MKSDDVAGLLPLVVLVVLAYFLLIRPTRRRARETAALQAALSPGDQVMLTSGIFGSVVAIEGESLRIEVAPDVVLTAHRGAVGKIVTDNAGAAGAGADGASTSDASTGEDAHDGHDGESNRGAV